MSYSIPAKKQAREQLAISFAEAPFEIPSVDIEYRSHGFMKKLSLPLPCLLTKFIEFEELSST